MIIREREYARECARENTPTNTQTYILDKKGNETKRKSINRESCSGYEYAHANKIRKNEQRAESCEAGQPKREKRNRQRAKKTKRTR